MVLLIFTVFGLYGQGKFTKKDSLNYCKKANEFISRYQFDKAIEVLNDCYYSDKLNIDYLKKIASCNYRLGRFKEAKQSYMKIIEQDSINVSAMNSMAIIYLKEGNYQESLNKYKRLVEIDSINSYYFKQIADLNLKIGDIVQSHIYYMKSYELNPNNIETIICLIKIYQELKLFSKVEEFIKEGISLDSTNVKLIVCEVKSAYRKRKYIEVVDRVNYLSEYKSDISSYMLKLLAFSYFYIEKYEKAISVFNELLKTQKESEIIHNYIGMAYDKVNEPDKSILHFKKAIKSSVSSKLSKYYMSLASVYEKEGMYVQSIQTYQAAYENSKEAKILYILARNYDVFYEDKNTALLYYNIYLKTNLDSDMALIDYSKQRVREIKKIIFLDDNNVIE
ncbi:MAG: hypothetical protein HRT66_05315 [Flavobacteriaceae bacterium]|nr:hypothetical protein [Flavobacteriaceae bacterium]